MNDEWILYESDHGQYARQYNRDDRWESIGKSIITSIAITLAYQCACWRIFGPITFLWCTYKTTRSNNTSFLFNCLYLFSAECIVKFIIFVNTFTIHFTITLMQIINILRYIFTEFICHWITLPTLYSIGSVVR